MAKSTFWADFKKFITKGNIVDMAVGVVVGGAFSKIVSSLVADIVTPLISLLTGKANLSELYAVLNPDAVEGVVFNYADYPTVALAQEAGFATLNYGSFLQTILDFLIIAFSIFLVLRVITVSKAKLERLKKKQEDEAAAAAAAAAAAQPPKPTAEDLLTEIRDLLKKENGK